MTGPAKGKDWGLLQSFGLTAEDLRAMGYKVAPGGGEEPGEPTGRPPAAGDTRERPPREGRWAVYTLLILALVAWGASPQQALPGPVWVAAPDTSFSSARAMVELVEIARRPRPVGSPEHDRVRDYLVQRLTKSGLEPDVQVALSYTHAGDPDRVVTATMRNVVARLPGSRGEGALILTAPYDGGTASPAAGHGAFALATILETVRALAAGPPLDKDVIVVFTDGEQLGSLGARAFVERMDRAAGVTAVLTVDALGATGPVVAFESREGEAPSLIPYIGAGVRPGPSSLMSSLSAPTAHGAGDDPFNAVGVPGLSFLALGDASSAGQPWDSAEGVGEETLQHAGVYLLAAARSLGRADTLRRSVEDAVVFPLPLVGRVEYPQRWVPWTTLVLVVIVALMGVVVKTVRRATWKGLLVGVAAGLAPVALSWWAGGALLDFVTPLHPERGWVGGAFYGDRTHFLALAGLALALVSGFHALARRWIRRDEAALGAMVGPLALCVWLTFRAPLAAYALQWPLALAIICTIVITLARLQWARSGGAWMLLMVISAAAVAVGAPSLELVSLAWTFESAAALGGLFAIAALLLVPLMEWMLRPKAWLLPTISVAVAAGLVIDATPDAGGSSEHPVLSSLVYLTDEEVPKLQRIPGATPTAEDSLGPRRVVGEWLTVPGDGEDWARSWVAEGSIGSTDPGVLLLPHEDLYEIAGAGPDAVLAPPRVRIVGDGIDGTRRTVRISVASPLGGEMVGLHVPAGTDAALVGVSEGPGHVSFAPARSLTHWGTGPGDSTFVDVSLGPGVGAFEILVLEHHMRPREVLGQEFFRRPKHIVPNQDLGGDRLIQRTDVRLAVPEA